MHYEVHVKALYLSHTTNNAFSPLFFLGNFQLINMLKQHVTVFQALGLETITILTLNTVLP